MRKIFTFLFAALMSAASMWAQTETLLTTITATGDKQASYSTANVATVSFSYTSGGASAYLANWGWWGYGWIATVNAAEGYTITKCVFYDDANRTATDSQAPFVVETTEEDKTPKVNGKPIEEDMSKGIKKIDVYGYATPTTYTLKLVADPTMGSVAVTNLLGSDIVDNGNGNYTVPENAKVTILATPNEGYEFSGWLEGNVLCDFTECGVALNTLDNPLTFTMTNDAACKAEFKAAAPQPQETVVTITEADYVSGNTITKDGVTLTVNQIYGAGSWYLVGPGTFTNTIGNFTKIEVTTVGGTVFIEGDGWTGDFDKMTWTGNAPSVSFVDDIMGKGQGFSIVCTIAAGEPEPAGKSIVVFEANGKKKEVEIELPHTFWCDLGSENGELDLIIQELYALPRGGYCDYFYDGPVATGNPAVTAGADDDANHFITISEAFEGTATVSGKYNKYTEMDEEDFTYTLTISIKDTPTAVENVQTNPVQTIKFFRDGQLLIEKNGKIYNVNGAEVK